MLGVSLAENILADLARYPGLSVIARRSSSRLRDGSIGIGEIGKTRGADLILEGSKYLDGRTLRVTARLVDAKSETEIWSDRIDTDLSTFFEVSDRISRRVAHAVEAVVADVAVRDFSADAADAFILNLEARKIVGAGLTPDTADAAIAASRTAVERYPEETWGHIALAFSLRLQHRFGWADDPGAVVAEALRHAETAVRLAPGNHLAYTALGRVSMRAGNALAVVEAFDQAMVLNPSAADTLNAQAQAYLYLGDTERGDEALARSAEIDPLPERVWAWVMAWTAWQERDCDAARQSFARMPAPPAAARNLEAAILICTGETTAAEAALARFLTDNPGWTQADERALFEGIWVAEGALDRWIVDLAAAGLPAE